VKDLLTHCDKNSVHLTTVDVSEEDDRQLSEQYSVRALPTLIFLDELGTEVAARLEGGQTASSLKHALVDLNVEHCDTLRDG
jgi:hypothetical protein